MDAWRSIGRGLSRRTVAVAVAVVAITALAVLGLGRLDFATGQDSYLDPASQVALDNERYQRLFGGENMVVLFSVPEGRTVVDLLDAANIEQLEQIEAQLSTDPAIQGVVSPVSLLRWTQDLITSGTANGGVGDLVLAGGWWRSGTSPRATYAVSAQAVDHTNRRGNERRMLLSTLQYNQGSDALLVMGLTRTGSSGGPAAPVERAVIGGIGSFAGASGSVTMTPTKPRQWRTTFDVAR